MFDENLYENEDLMWKTHMRTLMQRKRNMEIVLIIDKALEKYYLELGLPVPEWKRKKDPQWWIDYLKELNIDPNNP